MKAEKAKKKQSLFNFSQLMDLVAQQNDAVVNFEDVAGVTYQIPSLKLRHDQHYHHGNFCMQIKRSGGMTQCAQNKQKSIVLAQKRKQFEGYCPFGVWDLAQPVQSNDLLLGIVYCGSFRGTKELTLPDRHKWPLSPPLAELDETKKLQSRDNAKFLGQFVKLIYNQWIDKNNYLNPMNSPEQFRTLVSEYIEMKHHTSIRLADMAKWMKLHPNYLGRRILEVHGKSFKELLQDYRINRAKSLLCSNLYSINQVAYAVGFKDSNYFSHVFSKKEGLSPRQYRSKSDTGFS